MSQNKWWEDQGSVHAMLKVARDLDAQYQGREIIALGHSPSWIVVCVAMLRQINGVDKNVSYIPFSGSHRKINRENLFSDGTARGPHTPHEDRVTFEEDEYRRPNASALSEYFSYLSAHGQSPAQIMERSKASKADKAVLIDYATTANGAASFIDIFTQQARRQGLESLDPVCDIHLYKLEYEPQDEIIDIKLSDGSDEAAYPVVHIDGSANAYVLEGGAGARGALHKSTSNDYQKSELRADQRVARFMPYYGIAETRYYGDTEYKGTPSGFSHASTSPEIIAAAKKSLRDAFEMPMDKSREIAEAKIADIRAWKNIVTRNCWMPRGRSWH